MTKLLLPLFFLGLSLYTAAQDQNQQPTGTVVFHGYIFTEDSVPVEDAFLINYRTSKIVTTDKKGYFKTLLLQGDSLMINHLSLSPKVIYAEKADSETIKVYVPYRTYILKAISSGNYEKEKKNVDESMKQVKKDIDKQILIQQSQRTSNENPYDDDVQNPGITIPIIHLDKPKKQPDF